MQTQNFLICHSKGYGTQVTIEAYVPLILCFITTIGILGVKEIND